MNFDELQKQWDNQSSEDVKIESDLQIKKEANTVIDNVRKVMKKDFFFQLTSFPLLFVFPFIEGYNTNLVWWLIVCISTIMIVPLFYIYKFYEKSYKLEYNSLKNLNWFYYSYKSSINIFSLYTYTMCILMIMFVGVLFIEHKSFFKFSHSYLFYVYIIGTLIVYVAFCVCILKWWINTLYKKPLIELENILNQLEE